jgi:DNA-binding CsgD family transcriptional regulator
VLLDRGAEIEALDRLIEAVVAGNGRALVVRGEAGVGKSALLGLLDERASACRVIRLAGVQPEMELPYAGLHQLCAPLLDRLDAIPAPQRDALGRAFGLRSGPAPDRFMVGLAVLSLLDEISRERPLICVVDDAQWLDRTSRQGLAFVARRLQAESLALVFVVQQPDADLRGVPELIVSGLPDEEARALVRSVAHTSLDERVLDRIVGEARGNPLALLEVPRALADGQLAGGFGLPAEPSAPGLLRDSFRRRLERLPPGARWLALIAAAEPVGEPALVWRAAEHFDIDTGAAVAATRDLLQLAGGVRFRHPLVRSVVYQAASPDERRRAHAALAAATDAEADADRRAWHRAHATADPDEDVAAELERSAATAQARGGLSAAAAFLHRAALLTPEPATRARRALGAAQAEHDAGAPETALSLLAMAEAGSGTLSDLERARTGLLRAEIAFAVNRGKDAPGMLIRAARELELLDVPLARETYLQALSAAMFAARLSEGDGVLEAAWAGRVAPAAPSPARAPDLLLDALSVLTTDGASAATPMMKRALEAFAGAGVSVLDELRWSWMAFITAVGRWDEQAWRTLAVRHVQVAREAGALGVLPLALSSRIVVHLHEGELDQASALSEEVQTITEATGLGLTNYGALALAAWIGREAEAAALMEASWRRAVTRSEGIGLTVIQWAGAVLFNGLGRYEEARSAAQQASARPAAPGAALWALVELVEAAGRSGERDMAVDALARLGETTQPAGTDWALGLTARCRALLSDGDDAEASYREAIERLERTRLRVDRARARLLYGEWLRRRGRRVDARQQLRAAHETFATIGMQAFEQRAARELQATGATSRKRIATTGAELTVQERQVARLAGDGLSNPEIAARLFISPRTVEYHLRKVFTKLDISSRTKLATVLPGGSADEARPWR